MMRFRQREAIRVIFETDVIAELAFYVCLQRPAIQVDGDCNFSWCLKSGYDYRASQFLPTVWLLLCFAAQTRPLLWRTKSAYIPDRAWDAYFFNDDAGLIKNDPFNFRPTEINSDFINVSLPLCRWTPHTGLCRLCHRAMSLA